MESNYKDGFNVADLGDGLNAEDRASLSNPLKEPDDRPDMLSPKVWKRVLELKKIQTQHDKMEAKFLEELEALEERDANFFEDVAALEAKYPKLYQPLWYYTKDEMEAWEREFSAILNCLRTSCKTQYKKMETKFIEERAALEEREAKFFEERAALETKYEELYQPLYTKRYEIVNGVGENETAATEQADKDEDKGVPDFWLDAMINNVGLAKEISRHDWGALKFLKDIKWSRVDSPKDFKLEFYFDTNPFFKNSVLTKTYHVIEEDIPVLEKAIGTEIEWHPGKCLTTILNKKRKKRSKISKPITKTEQCKSFFNFFSPPQFLDGKDDKELERLFKNYYTGLTFQDQIIPRAVSWYMGEAEDDEDDFGDDDDDDDENE